MSSMFLLRARAFHSRSAATKQYVAKPDEIFRHVLVGEPNTAWIRVGRNKGYLRSPADALALIRDVERRFGAVREYHFKRDCDQNTRYQAFVHVVFEDSASYQLLPSELTELSFELPSADPDQPGGVGLEDLTPFLRSRLFEQPSNTPPRFMDDEGQAPERDTISYTVKQGSFNFVSASIFTKGGDVSTKAAESFLRWGGFSPLKPIPAETELRIEDVFSPTSIDHYRMRCALRRYSDKAAVPNPYEIVPGQEHTPQEWEPLLIPDPESTSQDLTWPDVLPESRILDLPGPSSSPVPDATSASQDAPMPGDVLAESASDASTPHRPPSPNTPSTSTSSTQPRPDTTQTPVSPSAQPESPDQKPVEPSTAATPSPAPASSSTPPAQPSTTSSGTLTETENIAAKMHQQAKIMTRAQKKKEKRKMMKEANPLPDLSKKGKSTQPSTAQKARPVADAPHVEKPKTMGEKISGFFSSIW